MLNVVLYSTGCPKCEILEEKLNAKNIPYDIERNEEVMKELGIEYTPMLSVNGELMNFAEAIKWVKEY